MRLLRKLKHPICKEAQGLVTQMWSEWFLVVQSGDCQVYFVYILMADQRSCNIQSISPAEIEQPNPIVTSCAELLISNDVLTIVFLWSNLCIEITNNELQIMVWR